MPKPEVEKIPVTLVSGDGMFALAMFLPFVAGTRPELPSLLGSTRIASWRAAVAGRLVSRDPTTRPAAPTHWVTGDTRVRAGHWVSRGRQDQPAQPPAEEQGPEADCCGGE